MTSKSSESSTDSFGVILSHLTSYLPNKDLKSLRLVSSSARIIVDVDMGCNFKVVLNNFSLQSVRDCVPYIQEVEIGLLTNPDFLKWPDSLFPKVKKVSCTNLIQKANALKLFRVFPNVREVRIMNLTGKEMTPFLELQFGEQDQSILDRVSLFSEIVPPGWSLITKLEIVLNKISDDDGEVFGMLSKRFYPQLTSLHLEYRLLGYNSFDCKYDQLHIVYIHWLKFVGLNSQSLKNLTLTHDFGADYDPQLVPDNPQDNLELTQPDSPQFFSLTDQLQSMGLEELSLKPQFHEEISNTTWNWNRKLLKFQDSLVHLNLDCSHCWNLSDPEILREILDRSKDTLKSFEYTSTSFKSLLGIDEAVTFDLSMLWPCTKLEKLRISRGWSHRPYEWGPPIVFENIEYLPQQNLKTLTLATENGKLKRSQASWISTMLERLEEVQLSICMSKALVTNFLQLPSLKRFALVRDCFVDPEISVLEMVRFCRSTPGLSCICSNIKATNKGIERLELLSGIRIVSVQVDRNAFRITNDLVQKVPGLLLNETADI